MLLLAALHALHVAYPDVVPGPTSIASSLFVQLMSGELPSAVLHGLLAILLGFSTAVAVGVPVGLAMGSRWQLEAALEPYVYALYVAPFAALVPAFVIWFGTGIEVRVIVVFFFALFPIAVNTHQGAKSTPASLVDAVRSFGAGTRYVLVNVVVPHEIPYVMAGLRIGIGRAVKGLIVAELLVSVSGFGAIITRWSSAFRLDGLIGVVLVIMGLGIVLTWAVGRLERSLVHWDRSHT